jgi:ornithine cyclodeaminase/alanine dehydrogenase-like protein (mu-crystallin family)
MKGSRIRPEKSRSLHQGTQLASVTSRHAARKSHTIVTDSLQQVDGYDSYASPFFLQDTPERKRMIELDELVAGKRKGRSSPDELTLFCSVGLAGTEVVVADAAFKSLTKPQQFL